MEIVLAVIIMAAICVVPTAAYLLYTLKRPEPFADRK